MFGAGTACIVSPVNGILYKSVGGGEEMLHIPTMEQVSSLITSSHLRRRGLAAHSSPHIVSVEDPHGWIGRLQSPCLMQRFYDAITDIHYGRVAKPDWQRIVE